MVVDPTYWDTEVARLRDEVAQARDRYDKRLAEAHLKYPGLAADRDYWMDMHRILMQAYKERSDAHSKAVQGEE